MSYSTSQPSRWSSIASDHTMTARSKLHGQKGTLHPGSPPSPVHFGTFASVESFLVAKVSIWERWRCGLWDIDWASKTWRARGIAQAVTFIFLFLSKSFARAVHRDYKSRLMSKPQKRLGLGGFGSHCRGKLAPCRRGRSPGPGQVLRGGP